MSDTTTDGLRAASSALVADALDELGLRQQTLGPDIRPLRHGMRLAGRAMPIRVIETERFPEDPYAAEMDAISALQPGEVPVFVCDAGCRAAAWGELFSCAAIGRGSPGAVVDGLIRDAVQIAELPFPTFARGCSPLDTQGRAEVVSFGDAVVCGGVPVRRSDFVVADEDGVVIVPAEAVSDTAAKVREKARDERAARKDLLAGVDVRVVWERYGVF